MTMTDEEITSALQDVGAAWLMDRDDEACQANALRHLVAAAEAEERKRCAKLCESIGPVLCESYGDGAECIATADACAEAILRA